MDAATLAHELNPPQRRATLHTEGPLMVFAGAGSGKTRVITYRVAHILQKTGVAPWRVMAVTFTNKAANEMRERIGRLVGAAVARELWVATFHATGAKLLRRYGSDLGLARDFAIYDDGDRRAVMNRVYDAQKLDEKTFPKSAVLHAIDRAKQEVLSPEALMARARTPFDETVALAYESYERLLAANNAVDFGDLLAKTVRLLETREEVRAALQERFRYVLVDEFQDTNHAQYRILRALVGPHENLCVVGDDDQAIYAWRGADVRNIQYFRRDFPHATVVKLEENYRSTKRILRAANAVISKARGRESKTLFTANPEGALIEVLRSEDERAEARAIALRVKGALRQGVPAREIAVFYRIHAQSRALEEAMRAENLPYAIVGGMRFYDRAEVKNLLAYLRLMTHPDDDVALLRVINTPPRKIGEKTIERLVAHAGAKQISVWRAIAAGDLPDDLGSAARKALANFYDVLSGLRREAAGLFSRPWELATLVYEKSGYAALLADASEPENEARRENVSELLGSMKSFQEEEADPTLAQYLERVSLSEETAQTDGKERVSLMTVHSAKGLEFRVVFVAAMEEGMFPYKGIDLGADPDEMEEERRLAYVAITRAREHLTLSSANFRQIFGQTRPGVPSRFLVEIAKAHPRDLTGPPVQHRRGAANTSAARATPAGLRHGPNEPNAPVDEGPVVVRDECVDPIPDDDPNMAGTRWRKGTRVAHGTWGPGTVRSVLAGSETKLEVYFPSIGQVKVVLARYVRPL
jgi:DNA helicase-2/ATP-dependent DNA helicase PcrA